VPLTDTRHGHPQVALLRESHDAGNLNSTTIS